MVFKWDNHLQLGDFKAIAMLDDLGFFQQPWMTHSHLFKTSTTGNIPQVFPKMAVAPPPLEPGSCIDRHRIVFIFLAC